MVVKTLDNHLRFWLKSACNNYQITQNIKIRQQKSATVCILAPLTIIEKRKGKRSAGLDRNPKLPLSPNLIFLTKTKTLSPNVTILTTTLERKELELKTCEG